MSKGNQNKRTKDQKSKNKGKVKMVYDIIKVSSVSI